MTQNERFERTVQVLKALGDPARLEIVTAVARGGCPTSCGQVSEAFELSQPAISHHFGKLVAAGVLQEQKNGTQKYYTVNTPLLESVGIDVSAIIATPG